MNVSPTDGNGPTQGQRKTLNRVGQSFPLSLCGPISICFTFSAKSSIKVDGDKIQVDPQLLFQRLISASQSLDDMSN